LFSPRSRRNAGALGQFRSIKKVAHFGAAKRYWGYNDAGNPALEMAVSLGASP
jgi:hypothetical protein